jgi:hypothetical protein
VGDAVDGDPAEGFHAQHDGVEDAATDVLEVAVNTGTDWVAHHGLELGRNGSDLAVDSGVEAESNVVVVAVA